MKNKNDFFEKYKHPKWQKRRLQKLENADFECELCGDSESTLNVHHKYYIKDNNPWEYKDKALACYCEYCHTKEHEFKSTFETMLNRLKEYFTFSQLCNMMDGIIGEYENTDDDECCYLKEETLIKGIRSGLLLKIGESLVTERQNALYEKGKNK